MSSPTPNGERLVSNRPATAGNFAIENATSGSNRHIPDDRLSIALQLAQDGYFLVPVTIRRVRKPDGRVVKSPSFHEGWRFGGSRDPLVIKDWYAQFDCSYAVHHESSGTEAVDLDPKDGGLASWDALGLPGSVHQVLTPSGGLHLYWRRVGQGIGTNAGKLAAGVDARSVGGVTFAPGSIVLGLDGTSETARYSGTLPAVAALEPTPDAVVAAFAAHQREQRPADGAVTVHDYAWVVEQFRTQLARVRAFDPATQSGFRELIMGAAMLIGRGTVLWPGELIAQRLEHAAADVWGNADDDDREWIRRGMADGLARERWEVTGVPEQRPAEVPDEDGPVPDRAEKLRNERLEFYRADQWARREFARENGAQPAEPAATGLAALLSEEIPGAKYRVDRLWPAGGKVLLAAPQKAGKTTMVGNLVRCLADGDSFLASGPRPSGWLLESDAGFRVEPTERSLLLLDFEMTRRMMQEWLRDQRIRSTDTVYVELLRGRRWDPREDHERTRWADFLRERNVGTLIVDPVGPVLASLGINENDSGEVRVFLHALDALVHESGADDLLVTHHTGHDGERPRGATAFGDWPDALWKIVKVAPVGGPAQTFLSAIGRDVLLGETQLEYDRITRRLSLGEGNRVTARGRADAETVVGIVTDTPGIGVNELRKALKAAGIGSTGRQTDAMDSARGSAVVHLHYGPNRAHEHFVGRYCEVGQGCPERAALGTT